MRTAIGLVAVILNMAILFGASADSVVPGTTAGAPPIAGGKFTGTEDHVRIVSIARDTGNPDRVIVTLAIDPGYHINANPPSDKSLIPTTLTFNGYGSARMIYPKPLRFKFKFPDEALDVYQGIE